MIELDRLAEQCGVSSGKMIASGLVVCGAMLAAVAILLIAAVVR